MFTKQLELFKFFNNNAVLTNKVITCDWMITKDLMYGYLCSLRLGMSQSQMGPVSFTFSKAEMSHQEV